MYAASLTGATDISNLGAFDVGGGVLKTVDQMSAAELAAVGVVPVGKKLHVDLAQAGYAGVEKVEGLALLPTGQLALLNDNDFGVAQIVIDNATGRFTLAPGYVPEVPVLGIVNVPGSMPRIATTPSTFAQWPVFGMYEPDAIAAFEIGQRQLPGHGQRRRRTRLAGAAEEVRVGSLTLDATAFPNGATLKANGNLGRLNVTKTLGDTDGDGDFDSSTRSAAARSRSGPTRARRSSTAAATSSASSRRATRRSSTPATTTAPSTAAPTTRDRSRKR